MQYFYSEPGKYKFKFNLATGTGGYSMACMHRVVIGLKLNQIRLFGFDSFERKLSKGANEDWGIWKPGRFATMEETREFLNVKKIDWNHTHLIKGWLTDTLTNETAQKYGIQKVSVVKVDCDAYLATKDALNYLLPFITDHSVIFFDNWRDDITCGEYEAYVEFLGENRVRLRSDSLGTYKPAGMVFLLTNLWAGH